MLQIMNDMQLVAAMEYVKANPVKFELDALENACGVGVTVTPEQIKEAVLEKIEKNLGQIKTQRYRFGLHMPRTIFKILSRSCYPFFSCS